MATHSSILGCEISPTKGPCPWGRKESDTTEWLNNNEQICTGYENFKNLWSNQGSKKMWRRILGGKGEGGR